MWQQCHASSPGAAAVGGASRLHPRSLLASTSGGFLETTAIVVPPTQRPKVIVARRQLRLIKCAASSASPAARSESTVFRHPGEPDLNLWEYMVVLEKPVGLTLAPDPKTGQVVVQDIKTNSPAHKCGLIHVGDVIKSCSAVFGDDMWAASDIRRVRWAINSRMGDVRLILERCRRHGANDTTAWYCAGKSGVATREREGMQLPYCFDTLPDDSASLMELPGAGRALQVAFHRNTVAPPPPSRRAAAADAARTAALLRLRRELQEARSLPRLDLSGGAMHPRPGGSDSFVLPAAASTIAAATGAGRSAAGGSGAAGVKPAAAGGGGMAGQGQGGPFKSAAADGDAAGGSAPPAPVVDFVAPAPSKDGDAAPSTSGGGGEAGAAGVLGLRFGGAGGASIAAPVPNKERRVVTFMPWLMVACGRLEHRHIAHIASSRSLGALLELSLTRGGNPQPADQQQQPAGQQPPPAGAAAGAASTAKTSPSSGRSGYLVVRGTDLVPLGSDVGRVSFQALMAAAVAAGNNTSGSTGGSSSGPTGTPASTMPGTMPGSEAQAPAPAPPPPGSAAATAAMLAGPGGIAAQEPAGAGGAASASGGGGGGLVDAALIASGALTGSASGGGGAEMASADNGGSGGIGSGTMAFLGRSIFVNLRPNIPITNTTGSAGSTATAAGKPLNPIGNAVPLPGSSASSGLSPASASAASPRASPSGYDPSRVLHLLNAAASLQRLTFRRGGKLHRARRDQCAVLLHCDEGMEADVAVLLAGWLHWFGRMPLQEASLAAETALGATVDQGLLEAGTAALLHGARERCSRVVLTWKYGGLSAYVAGDVVASWAARVPMVRCRSPLGCKGDTHPGHFYLEVQGLRPGAYYYKYIVDGTWAVDSLSSKVLDAAGNWNNVLLVPEPPQVLTSREGLALARWQAGRLALEAKMGLTSLGAVQRPH